MSYNADEIGENADIIIIESYDMDIPDDGPVNINPLMPMYQFHHYARREEPTQENVAEIPPHVQQQGVFADISFHVQEIEPIVRQSPILFQENDAHENNEQQIPSPASSEATIPASRSPSPVLRLECTTFPVKQEAEAAENKEVVKKTEKTTCECDCHRETTKTKKRPLSDDDDDDEDDGKLCPICFDVWTNSGEHRICAIKCGHLFGHSCLERWLSTQRTCPTCKRPVKKTDIRFIYAKKLIALDTSFLNALQLQLTTEQLDKNKLQTDLIQSKQREELSRQEIVNLKKQISVLHNSSQNGGGATLTQNLSNKEVKFQRHSTLEISNDGGCRVMDFYKNSSILVVSAQSPNPLFSGYGIKKVSITNSRNSVFIPLHSNTIRDLSFHPQAEILLSASIDKCVRLTETNNNKSVHTVHCTVPIWSCCWDTSNPVYFYVGEQTGEVCKYDMRKTNEKLNVLKVPGDFSPVVSLATIGWNQDANTPKNGVIVCKLNSCSVFIDSTVSNTQNQAGPSTANHYPLGLSGPFVSMRYCNDSKHLLVSSRPNMQYPFAKHTISTLSSTSYGGGAGNFINCNVVHTFQGAHVQKLLSRSCQMKINTDMFVAAHNESQKGVELFSVATGNRKILIPASSPVLDLCHVQMNTTGSLLCALNEKKVDIYRLDFS